MRVQQPQSSLLGDLADAGRHVGDALADRPERVARLVDDLGALRRALRAQRDGLHRAPFFGASIDFAEHRGYVPGDDIRRVDWRLYARTDRYYVKQYEADTNTNFTILGKAVEMASGKPLGAFMKERIFTPLGMTRTSFATPPSAALLDDLASGHPGDGTVCAGGWMQRSIVPSRRNW